MAKVFSTSTSYKIYSKELTKLPNLSLEREQQLRERMINNPSASDVRRIRDEFVSGNLRMVIKWAHRFIGMSVDLEDLIAEGNMGLCIAFDRFDWTTSFRFNTYAMYWVKQRMVDAVNRREETISLDQPVGEDDSTLIDVIENEHAPRTDQELMNADWWKEMMQCLDEREQYVIDNEFELTNFGVSTDTMSKQLGVCGERVRGIRISALHKLKQQAYQI